MAAYVSDYKAFSIIQEALFYFLHSIITYVIG